MKNIFIRLLMLPLFMACCITSAAQHTDSLYKINRHDSIYRETYRDYYVADSAYSKAAMRERKDRSGSHTQDSIRKKKAALQSANDAARSKTAYEKHKSESLFKEKNLLADSLHRSQKRLYSRQDSLRVLQNINTRLDTTHMFKTRLYSRQDSLRKNQNFNMRVDSLHKYRPHEMARHDSIRKKIYLENIKKDSVRLKKYLLDKKIQLQKMQADTAAVKNGFRSKEVSTEITCSPGDTVYINNDYKKVIINIKTAQKLRLSTTINYKNLADERDNRIFRNMGVELSRTNSSVTATIDPKKAGPAEDEIWKELNTESNLKRPLVIEIPANAVIVVNTKYGETQIENFITNISAEIINGTLKLENATHAVIKAKYSTIKAGDIKEADLNLLYSRFKASNISTLSIVSSTSNLKLGNCNSMNMTSTSDSYTLEKAGRISGNKQFGSLNIADLKDQLLLTGSGADVKITKLSYDAAFIKIDNKYADVKLPLYNQPNYAVYYEGSFKDVNKLSTAAQKINGMGSITAALSSAKDTLAGIGKDVNKTKFEAMAGDISGRHTKIDIVCPYCNVVFN